MEQLSRAFLFFLKKDYVADEVEQAHLQFGVFLFVFHACKVVFNLPLGRELRPQRIASRAEGFEKVLFDPHQVVCAEDSRQDALGNERLSIPFTVEDDASANKLAQVHGNGGHEVAHDAFNRMKRNAPNPEKPENVVDAERVEV